MSVFFRCGLLVLTFSMILGTPANAREATKAYTCSGLKQLIARRGAEVLNTKGSYVYKRFVANRTYCELDQITKSYSVPSKSGRCRLKICIEFDPDVN